MNKKSKSNWKNNKINSLFQIHKHFLSVIYYFCFFSSKEDDEVEKLKKKCCSFLWHLYCFLQQLKTTNVFNQSFSNEIPWISNIWWMSQEGGKCDFIWFNRVFLSISYPALSSETIRRIKWLKSLIFRIIKDFCVKRNEICKIFFEGILLFFGSLRTW